LGFGIGFVSCAPAFNGVERNRSSPEPFLRNNPQTGETAMNWDRIEGNWKQFKGKAREQWGKLTDDELDQVEGHREQLVGRIQEKYGIARDEAERQVRDWEGRL
jgi:uncharacterized protein YjbJ (UPF0337 family)